MPTVPLTGLFPAPDLAQASCCFNPAWMAHLQSPALTGWWSSLLKLGVDHTLSWLSYVPVGPAAWPALRPSPQACPAPSPTSHKHQRDLWPIRGVPQVPTPGLSQPQISSVPTAATALLGMVSPQSQQTGALAWPSPVSSMDWILQVLVSSMV